MQCAVCSKRKRVWSGLRSVTALGDTCNCSYSQITGVMHHSLNSSRVPCRLINSFSRRRTVLKAQVTGELPAAEDLLLADLRVVLVAPKTEANVGAVARACANFEAPNVHIVAPRCDVRSEEVLKVACGTYITDRLQVVDSLQDALADTVCSVGFTRRTGANRYVHACLGDLLHSFPDALPVHQSSSLPRPIVALVFGREESGLTEDEMRRLSHTCAIPSGRIHPSLNLSHAVSVVLSECFSRRSGTYMAANAPSSTISALSSSGSDAAACAHMDDSTADGSASTSTQPRPLWLQNSLQLGGRDNDQQQVVRYAVSSEVEHLLRKVANVASACGISPDESTGEGVHSRKRLPVGHIRAIMARSKVTDKEIRSLHGFASSLLETLQPGHPLGEKRRGKGSKVVETALDDH